MGCGYNPNGNYSNNIDKNEIISNRNRTNYLVTIDSSGGVINMKQKKIDKPKETRTKKPKNS
jgi:hypothetical protein